METLNNVDIEFEEEITVKSVGYRQRITGNVSKDSIIECAKLCEIDKIFTDEKIFDYVKNNFEPKDIFDELDLKALAEENYKS